VTREEYLEAMGRTIRSLRTAFVPSYLSLLPKCRVCGGPARPDVVAFGEPVRDFGSAERKAERARTLLVVGTTAEVYPAAGLLDHARGSGAVIVEVAHGPTAVHPDVRLEGPAGRILPQLAGLVAATGERSG